MKKIINGFLKKEVQRFGLSMAGLILCLIAVSVIPEVRPLLPVFAVVFSAIHHFGFECFSCTLFTNQSRHT